MDQPVAHGPPDHWLIAQRLDHLFAKIKDESGVPYTHRAVARAITEKYKISISHTYVGQLRSGEKDNPTIKQLQGLALFFGVPVEYFTHNGVAAQVDQELDLVLTLRDLREQPGLRDLVVRGRGISADDLKPALTVLDVIRKIAGLPANDQSQPGDPDAS